jgi:hypothetical protein
MASTFAGRASDKEIGLSMRVVRQYTINNDSIPTRLDVLYGLGAALPASWLCRIRRASLMGLRPRFIIVFKEFLSWLIQDQLPPIAVAPTERLV